jgi:bifunctional DNA-binding transcriptional regulator/antitoxin component of YhaV-PrlF toxin-antitoxin module
VKNRNVRKLSSNGQVSIPAEARKRWKTDRMLVIDMGEYVMVSPLPDDPIRALVGKYRGRGPSTDEMRRMARVEEEAAERRKRRIYGL